MYKPSDIRKFITQAMNNLRVELVAGEETWAEAKN